MPTAPPISDFLETREAYKLALAIFSNQERKLFELFGVSNSADLEDAILLSRTQGLKHAEEIRKFGELGRQLDRASDRYDMACAVQRRKVAEQQRLLDQDIKRLEC